MTGDEDLTRRLSQLDRVRWVLWKRMAVDNIEAAIKITSGAIGKELYQRLLLTTDAVKFRRKAFDLQREMLEMRYFVYSEFKVISDLQAQLSELERKLRFGNRIPIPMKVRKRFSKVTTCYYCNNRGTRSNGPDGHPWHLDHTAPYSRSATDDLVRACRTCNLRKHDKYPHEWPEGGRLL